MSEIPFDNNEYEDTASQELSSQTIDTELFYTGGGRSELLEKLEAFSLSDDCIALLTGDTGAGKTMLCKEYGRRARAYGTVVMFFDVVESFDEVLCRIGRSVGLAAGANFDELVAMMIQSGENLILIFDNAEQLYLANLERIRKLVDAIVVGGGSMHLLLAGKPDLLENYDQLSILDFQVSGEQRFELSPLSLEDIRGYLQFQIDHLETDRAAGYLGPGVAEKILNVGMGNFRRTAELAQQSLDGADVESSFMTLLENLEEESKGGEGKRVLLNDIHYLWQCYGRYWPWGVGLVALLLVLWFGAQSLKQPEPVVVKQKVRDDVQLQIPVQVAQPVEQSQPSVSVAKTTSAKPGANGANTTEQDETGENYGGQVAVSHSSDKVDAKAGNGRGAEQPAGKDIQPETVVSDQGEAEAVKGKMTEKLDVARSVDREKHNGADTGMAAEKSAGAQQQSVQKVPRTVPVQAKKALPPSQGVVLRARNPVKVRHKVVRHVEKVRGRKTEVQRVIAANQQFTVEQLYENRKQAGQPWREGLKNHMYTVQLMVLKARGAEKNLKRMLSQTRYRQEAGNFYIFSKTTSPETLFVFYGEYPDMATARLAQRSIPPFLRAHKPYAISVKAAIAKVLK